MGWTAPVAASKCQDEVVEVDISSEGAVHGGDYHDWSGYREARVSGSRGRCGGGGCRAAAVASCRGAEVLRRVGAVPGGDGGLEFR